MGGGIHLAINRLLPKATFQRNAPARRGHWATITRKVLVEPAHWEVRKTPALYERHRGRFGRDVYVCVRRAQVRRIFVPAKYELRTQRIWVRN